jgi:TP901 family phage tail tape measure protein
MAEKIKGITIEFGADLKQFNKALNAMKKDAKATEKELKYVDKALKLDPKNTELISQKFTLLRKEIKQSEDNLKELKAAQEQAEKAMESGAKVDEDAYRRLQREIVETESKLKDLRKEGTQASYYWKEIGGGLTTVGKKGMAVSAAIGGIGIAATAAASQFEDAFAKTLTIADTNEVAADDLKKAITDLSNETGIASAEVADNVYNAISAGQKTADAVNFVSESSKLAKAGFAESGAALDLLTTVLNAYGLEASKVTDVSDMLIQTQNLGKTTVGELAGAMGRVIPTAKANNVQFDQLSAAYSIMTAKGIATAETTTYLNAMLNELGKGGTKVDKVLRSQTGKSFSDLSKDGKSLSDVLAVLKDNADKNGIAFSDLWSSTEAGKAAITLLGDGADVFNDRLAEMNDSAGSTQTAFEKLDTSSNKAKKALNQIKNTGIELGSTILVSLQPVIESAADKIRTLTTRFGNLSDGQKRAVVITGTVVAAIPPLLIGIGSVCSAVGTLVGLIGGPAVIGAAVAIGAITAAVVGLNAATDKETEAFNKLNKEIDERQKRMNDLKTASAEQTEASIAEMHYLQNLKDELSKLADESGKVKDADKARAQFILDELNNALGTEYKMTGDQIDNYKELNSSIDDLIEKKTAYAILESKREAYDEAIKNMEKSKKAVDELSERYNKAKSEYEEYCDYYKNKSVDVCAADRIMLKDKKKNLEEQKDAYDKAIENYSDYVSAYEDYQEMSADITNGNAKKIVDKFEETAGLSSEYGKETGRNYADGLKDADPTAAANKLATKANTSLASAFDEKISSFNEIGDNVQNGIAGGLVNLNPLLKTRLWNMGQQVEKTLRQSLGINSPSKKTIPIGEGITEGVIKGTKNKEKSLKKALEEQAKKAVDTYSSFQKAYSDYASISLSRYNIWTYENPNASEAEKTQQKLEQLRSDAEGMNEVVWQANSRLYTMTQLYGESSKEGREALVEYTKQLEKLKKTTAEIYELEHKRKEQFVQAAYDLADSKYNLWEFENPNATDDEKRAAEKEKLLTQYNEQRKKVQDVNDALWEEVQRSGETSEASMKLQKQLYDEQLAYNKLAKAISDVNSRRTNLFSQSRYDLAESKYTLWESENPEAAETEKLTEKKKMLTGQYDEQGKKVKDLNDELWESNQLYGESSDASVELQTQLNNTTAEYNKLGKALKEVNEQLDKAERTSRLAYNRYYSQNAGSLRSMGVSDEDIEAAARKSSGYRGDTTLSVNNYIYGATPDSAYEISRKTEETVRNIGMEGVL